MWCVRVEQTLERVSGDGLEGNFWEEGLPSYIQSKRMKRSHSLLANYSRTVLLKNWTHVGDAGFYIAVGESRKHNHEAHSGWAQQALRRMESREGRALFNISFAPWVTITAQLIEKAFYVEN